MEVKKEIFRRVPPGDRWTEINGSSTLFTSLTDALEYYFQKNGTRQYFIDAGAGMLYRIVNEPDIVAPPPTFSIYGDTY